MDNEKVLLMTVVLCFFASLSPSIVFADTTNSYLPVSDGYYKDFAIKNGIVSHYTEVDDVICDGATTYIQDKNSVGARDSYSLDISNIPTGAIISQIAFKPCMSRNSTAQGSSIANVFYRLNGVDSADFGAYGPTGKVPVDLATTSTPLNILRTSSTAIESGVVYTSGTRGLRVSRLETQITYHLLEAPTTYNPDVNSERIVLRWADNSSYEDGYHLQRSLDGINYIDITTTSANTTVFSDNGLTASTTYYYRVRAFNNLSSSVYSYISATTFPNPPSAPTGIITQALSTTSIQISWNDVSGEDEYRLYRGPDLIADLSANITTYTDTGLIAGTAYNYILTSSNRGGQSNSYFTGYTAILPTAPSNLIISNVFPLKTSLTWINNPGSQQIVSIERSFDGNIFSEIATTSVAVASYLDNTILIPTTYYYRVRSYNTQDISAYSNIASSTFLILPLPPTNLIATDSTLINCCSIPLSWIDNATNEDGYLIERSVNNDAFVEIANLPASISHYNNNPIFSSTTYLYRVRAYNISGYSDYSNISTAHSLPNAPAQVTNLSATSTTAFSATLSWTDNSINEEGFFIDRSTNNLEFTMVGNVGPNTTTYTDTGLNPSVRYYYRIRAYNYGGAIYQFALETIDVIPIPDYITYRFYDLTGDGWVTGLNYAASIGEHSNSTDTIAYIWGGSSVSRAFLPVDTSALPNDSVILSADLYVRPGGRDINDTDTARDYIALVGPTTQDSSFTLSNTDFTKCGNVSNPVLLSTKINSTDPWPLGGPVAFHLNEAGIGTIAKGGVTMLGIREGHDIENTQMSNPEFFDVWYIKTQETVPNETYFPYLEVKVKR